MRDREGKREREREREREMKGGSQRSRDGAGCTRRKLLLTLLHAAAP